MTAAELQILCDEETQRDIELNIERAPSDVALDKGLRNSALVATQVKYLQRAKSKLPSYFAARCIIPPRAFEQSSSESAARAKAFVGRRALDLTCGLGVDAAALALRFDGVVTLERDEALALVAVENFRRLGVDNVDVVAQSAQEYLRGCEEHFDYLYVDPDRRGEDGSKRVLLEDCSPNVLALWDDISRVCDRVVIKCSPMFDCDEAFRLFEGCDVEVVSVGDECKEVVIYASTKKGEQGGQGERKGRIGATSVGRGGVWLERSSFRQGAVTIGFDPSAYDSLIVPDVALQKGRIAREVLSEVCDVWSDNGYGFSTVDRLRGYDASRHLSRVFGIEAIYEYEPRKLRRVLSDMGVKRADILKREFPYSVKQITAQLKIAEGGTAQLAFTKIQDRLWMVVLKSKER